MMGPGPPGPPLPPGAAGPVLRFNPPPPPPPDPLKGIAPLGTFCVAGPPFFPFALPEVPALPPLACVPNGFEMKIVAEFDGSKYSDPTPIPPSPALLTTNDELLGGSWIVEKMEVLDRYVNTADPPGPPDPPVHWPLGGVDAGTDDPPGTVIEIVPLVRTTCVFPLGPGSFPPLPHPVDGPGFPAPPGPPRAGMNWVPEGRGPCVMTMSRPPSEPPLPPNPPPEVDVTVPESPPPPPPPAPTMSMKR